MHRRTAVLAVLGGLFFFGLFAGAQEASTTEADLAALVQRIADLRVELAAMEERILEQGSEDLLGDELLNLEYEERLVELGQQLLVIESRFLAGEKEALLNAARNEPSSPESLRAMLELLRIEEMIALAKGELAAGWQESGLVQQKLTLELKKGILEDIEEDLLESAQNEPPVACFDPAQSADPAEGIVFVDCSDDPDGEIVAYRWDLGDGTTSDEPNPQHNYAEPGAYAVTLQVIDDKGATAVTTRIVEILPLPPVACFDAPEEVWAGEVIEFLDCSFDPDGEIVGWSWSLGDARSSEEQNPQQVFSEPGSYTIRLSVIDDQGLLDQTEQIMVVRAAVGSLEVVAAAELTAVRGDVPKDVLLVVDLSTSMGEFFENSTKLAVAQELMRGVVQDLPGQAEVGLRTFQGCERSELVTPIQPLDRDLMISAIDAFRIGRLTPLAYTLEQLRDDFAEREGPHLIVMVTDGMETCGGDPVAVAKQLVEEGYDLRVHVVGYDIDDAEDQGARQQLEAIAAATGGEYFDVRSRDELGLALGAAVPLTYRIADGSGELVAEGFVGDPPQELPAGRYTIRVSTEPELVLEDVVVGPNERVTVTVSRE